MIPNTNYKKFEGKPGSNHEKLENGYEILWTGIFQRAGSVRVQDDILFYSQFEIGLRNDGVVVWRQRQESVF